MDFEELGLEIEIDEAADRREVSLL